MSLKATLNAQNGLDKLHIYRLYAQLKNCKSFFRCFYRNKDNLNL